MLNVMTDERSDEVKAYFDKPAKRPHEYRPPAAWQQGDWCSICGYHRNDSLHRLQTPDKPTPDDRLDSVPLRQSPLYAELLANMRTASPEAFVDDLKRFVDTFGDHDSDCPVADTLLNGREEVDACVCGFARRFDLYDEVLIRLGRT